MTAAGRKRTLYPGRPVYVIATGSAVGHEEAAGPLGGCFDLHDAKDDRFGQKTWEMAESEMQRMALSVALNSSRLGDRELDMLLAGDLLNQCVGSAYGLLSCHTPYLGLYGACSTAAEGLLLGALLCGAALERCGAVTSSHYCTAERQFRFPMEYGGQRAPTAQWTATAAGAFLLSSNPADRARSAGSQVIRIMDGMAGESVDGGITDINNMGAAMAPAVADTLRRYLEENGREAASYDLLVTGDLGREGSGILRDLLAAAGHEITACHVDCGLLLYGEGQDKHAGGSGCGCSASIMASHVLRNMAAGVYRDVLFVGSGALMNPMVLQQGSSIPGIGHLVHFKAEPRETAGRETAAR